MSNKNRIQQPYGYREQNDFSSSIGMVCEAITNGGSEKDIIKQLVEKINIIFAKAFVRARYNADNEELEFFNFYGAEVDRVEFPYIVKTAEFDSESNKIKVTFKDASIEPIEVSLDDLVSKLQGMIDDEVSARTEADQEIWDAIGEISGGSGSLVDLIEEETSARTEADQEIWDAIGEMSGSSGSLVELIEQETSARTEGDEDLWEALSAETEARQEEISSIEEKIDEEASNRESADTELWDAIGEISGGSGGVIELIEQEASARTQGDEELWDGLNTETEARNSADTEIWDAIGEIGASGTNLVEMIQQEVANREEGDNELWEALSAETEAREENDTLFGEKLDEEISNREAADTSIWEALSAETEARIDGDENLENSIQEEAEARAANDGALSGAIETETEARETADTELDSKISGETSAREANDAWLNNKINEEIANRESADTAILNALNSETQAREDGDAALSGAIDDNKVSIVKVETSLPNNVKEAFELKNALGDVLGDRINIYKDSSLKNVELVDEYLGRQGQFLKFTYILEDGTEKDEYVDVSQFLVEAEFKDGLVVNNAGEVLVKIDTASEEYLTVSPSGVKLMGVDAIAADLANEKTMREISDTNLETLIATEEAARLELANTVSAEITDRQREDEEIRTALDTEKQDRLTGDTALNNLIQQERDDRANGDTILNNAILLVSSGLTDESRERERVDTDLQRQIDELSTESGNLGNRVTTLESGLATEIEARISGDTALQLQVDDKANSVDVYYKTEADLIFARKEEIPTDFYTQAEVDEKDREIKAMVTAETAAREADDADLNNAITAETFAREQADNGLQRQIDEINGEMSEKLVDIDTTDLFISIDKTNPTEPKISFNVSEQQDNIISKNYADGIYAKATLEYNDETNTLIYSTSNAETKYIPLKTKSSIDRIYYNASNETIVIEYTVNGTRKEDVIVPVGDLIDEWRVEDGNQGAIGLHKERESGSSKDVLSARLILNTAHDDNVAIIDDNALYVSKNAIISAATAEIDSLKARVLALEQALSAATAEHTSQSNRISAVEQVNATQTNQISEINTKNQSQDARIMELMGYHESELEP